MLRSATSIGANIIEAQAASSRRDFRNFLNHALKSANETKFWRRNKLGTHPIFLLFISLNNVMRKPYCNCPCYPRHEGIL
ncbi:MAG: four helix bundle protein [Nitrospirota bacterium]